MDKKALIEKMSGLMSAVNRLLPKNPRKIVFYSNMGFRDNVKAVYDYLISQDCSGYSIVCAVNDWEDFAKRPHPDHRAVRKPCRWGAAFLHREIFFLFLSGNIP